jgi:hypothetical protein
MRRKVSRIMAGLRRTVQPERLDDTAAAALNGAFVERAYRVVCNPAADVVR